MPSEPKTGPFRVFFGDENHYLDRAIQDLRSGGREVLLLDGEDSDGNEIVSICETYSDKSRGVIIDNASKVKNSDTLVKFVESRSNSDRSVFLVAIIRSDSLKGWAKVIAERGKVTPYMQPKPWDTKKQLHNIELEALRCNVRLEDGVSEMLLRFLGYDLSLIANELTKASYVVDAAGKVTKKVILGLIPHVFPVQPWDVAEAAFKGNRKQAMSYLSFVYQNAGAQDGVLVSVVHSFLRMLEKLLVARDLVDSGASDDEIADRLGMHAYAYKTNLAPIVKRYSMSRLVEHMKNICKLDKRIKGTAVSKRTLVELAVLSL